MHALRQLFPLAVHEDGEGLERDLVLRATRPGLVAIGVIVANGEVGAEG